MINAFVSQLSDLGIPSSFNLKGIFKKNQMCTCIVNLLVDSVGEASDVK